MVCTPCTTIAVKTQFTSSHAIHIVFTPSLTHFGGSGLFVYCMRRRQWSLAVSVVSSHNPPRTINYQSNLASPCSCKPCMESINLTNICVLLYMYQGRTYPSHGSLVHLLICTYIRSNVCQWRHLHVRGSLS